VHVGKKCMELSTRKNMHAWINLHRVPLRTQPCTNEQVLLTYTVRLSETYPVVLHWLVTCSWVKTDANQNDEPMGCGLS